jgi:DNA-binding MarR family transcriptional regulator
MSEKNNKYCNCLYYSANALAREIGKLADEEFAVTGLAPSHAFLLMSVIEKPGLQPMEISRIMMLSPSTITRFIEKLESKGLVERETSGKYTSVFPTAKGKELKTRLADSWQALHKRYFAIIGPEKSQDLTAAVYAAALQLEHK